MEVGGQTAHLYIHRAIETVVSERTTIQVDRETLQVLEYLKRAQGAKSYGEVLRVLIRDSKRLSRSERGSLPKLREFRREKRDRLD